MEKSQEALLTMVCVFGGPVLSMLIICIVLNYYWRKKEKVDDSIPVKETIGKTRNLSQVSELFDLGLV